MAHLPVPPTRKMTLHRLIREAKKLIAIFRMLSLNLLANLRRGTHDTRGDKSTMFFVFNFFFCRLCESLKSCLYLFATVNRGAKTCQFGSDVVCTSNQFAKSGKFNVDFSVRGERATKSTDIPHDETHVFNIKITPFVPLCDVPTRYEKLQVGLLACLPATLKFDNIWPSKSNNFDCICQISCSFESKKLFEHSEYAANSLWKLE